MTKARRELAALSTEEMFARLGTLDPERAESIDAKNRPRLERAIEIAAALGAVPALPPRTPRFDALWLGVAPARDELQHLRGRGLAGEADAQQRAQANQQFCMLS